MRSNSHARVLSSSIPFGFDALRTLLNQSQIVYGSSDISAFGEYERYNRPNLNSKVGLMHFQAKIFYYTQKALSEVYGIYLKFV